MLLVRYMEMSIRKLPERSTTWLYYCHIKANMLKLDVYINNLSLFGARFAVTHCLCASTNIAMCEWFQVYGDEHASVAESLSNLAALLGRQGKYAEATPLYQQSLAIRRKVMLNGFSSE